MFRLLTFLLHIREAPGSNLGLETGYPVWYVMVFLSPSRQMRGWYLKLGHGSFLPHPFSLSSLTYHPFFRRCIVWATEESSLNKVRIKVYCSVSYRWQVIDGMNSSPSQSAKVVSRADCIAKSIALEFYHNDYKVLHWFFLLPAFYFSFNIFLSLSLSFPLMISVSHMTTHKLGHFLH
jgi:hypothetical protein